jgi:hypothetical protein
MIASFASARTRVAHDIQVLDFPVLGTRVVTRTQPFVPDMIHVLHARNPFFLLHCLQGDRPHCAAVLADCGGGQYPETPG